MLASILSSLVLALALNTGSAAVPTVGQCCSAGECKCPCCPGCDCGQKCECPNCTCCGK